jgi:hypothetical protein
MTAVGRPGWRRGVALALLQGGLLLSLAGQLLLDRVSRPRGWIRTEPVDPHLPIRGRYVDLALVVPAPAGLSEAGRSGAPVVLRAEGGQVRAELAGASSPRARSLQAFPQPSWAQGPGPAAAQLWRLEPRVAFFIPPDVPDPSRRPPGEQLWVEVTLPAEGPPRPIRLGVKREGGPITPLALR